MILIEGIYFIYRYNILKLISIHYIKVWTAPCDKFFFDGIKYYYVYDTIYITA